MFEISEPTTITFICNGVLNIKHENGLIYHLQETTNKRVKVKFPRVGFYESKNEIDLINLGIELPPTIENTHKQDRSFSASNFEVVYNPNLTHTPARIFYEIARCEVGPKFKQYPTQWQQFIIEHEKAHLRYSSEFGADIAALNSFLKQGFNSSQAFYALSEVLTKKPQNLQRIKEIYKSNKSFNNYDKN